VAASLRSLAAYSALFLRGLVDPAMWTAITAGERAAGGPCAPLRALRARAFLLDRAIETAAVEEA
jgi:hypothetical protein